MDELLLFRRKDWTKAKNWPDFIGFLKSLRASKWDLVVDFQGLFRSGVCSIAARDNCWGFADAREGATLFYKEKVSVPEGSQHAVDKNIYLLNKALGTNEPYESPKFKSDAALIESASKLITDNNLSSKMIAVAPVSRWESKNWPIDFYAAALNKVYERDPECSFWFVGTDDDYSTGEAIAELCDFPIANLMGKTDLTLLFNLLSTSKALLSNDSGPMHMAAAVETPVVAMFGPTSAEKTGPYGIQHTVLQSQVECSPCYNRLCPLEKQICLDDFSPDKVAEILLKLTQS